MLGKFSTIISSKIFSVLFYFSSSYGTPITQMLVCLILSQRSLRLSSIFFIPFPLVCSSAVISVILSSSSLICSSASVILLCFLPEYFLISVTVLLITVCLFFISSMSLWIVFNYVKCFLHFLHYIFKHYISSIFTIIIMNSLSGRLLISYLFGLVSFYLAFFICAVFLCFFIIFFFLTWSTWSLLFPGSRAVLNFFLLVFILGGKCWLGGLCWFPIGVTCACVLITGSLACPSGGLGILLSPRCCFVGVVPYLHEFLMYLWES